MNSIGEQVRQERERQGLSLEDVSERTRITVQNLEAIEQDNFGLFPNRVYARAFLRDYANFLGMDSAALLERYEQQRAEAPEPESAVARPSRGLRPAAYAVLAVLVLCVLGGGGYFGWRLHDEYLQTTRETKPAAPPAERQTVPVPVPPAQHQPDSAAVQPAPAEPKLQAAPSPGQNVLKLTALGTVWVHLQVDGRREIYTNLSAGTSRTYYPKKKVFIHVGKANSIMLEFNGKKFTLGAKSNPAKWAYP